MTLNMLNEFLIHFHTYRNIDLVNQGLYQIHIRIYYIENGIKYYAVPYYFSDSRDSDSNILTEENAIRPHNIITSYIHDNGYEYITKTFLIRYSDEEVDIDEFCHFRIETPKKSKNDISLYIEYELFFSDALLVVHKERKNNINNIDFKCASSQVVVFNIENLKKGLIQSYIPIMFIDNFSSLLNSSIHIITSEYKLKINNSPNFSIYQNKPKAEATKNMSLIHFFLEEKDCQYTLDSSLIDSIYDNTVSVLIHNYFSLRNKYSKLVSRLIEEKMKSEYSFFLFIPPLHIYSDQRDKEIITVNEINYTTIPKLSRRINDYTSEYISTRIMIEINLISSNISQLWHRYVEIIKFFPYQTCFMLHSEYMIRYKIDLGRFIKKSIINITENGDLLIPIENNLAEMNKNFSIEMRNKLSDSFITPIFENSDNYIKPEIFPVLFEENYIKQMGNENILEIMTKKSFYDYHQDNSSEENNYEEKNSIGLHLIILVHGFQGNSFDMRLIKNIISIVNPACVFLSSISNQDDTEGDIVEMGKRLANEVRTFIKECSDGVIFRKISFIGHSIGGLIIRSCLPFLKDYSSKMWFYISLSSPHLGYIYSTSKIVEAGLWVLKTWKKSKCLEQICSTDSKNLKDSFIYKLSEYEGLNWFTHVYFLSSHQDYYAPFESTRVQLCNESFEDDIKAGIYRHMAYNILSKLKKDSLKRIDINFVIHEKNLDSFIGRTAHIQFLENISFMKILFYNIEEILK